MGVRAVSKKQKSVDIVGNKKTKDGRPRVYTKEERKMLTVKMYVNVIAALKKYADDKCSGNLTKAVNDIVTDFLTREKYL